MSLNLHCNEVDLAQTPTNITLDLYYVNGHKRPWLEIAHKYVEWYETCFKEKEVEVTKAIARGEKLTFRIV